MPVSPALALVLACVLGQCLAFNLDVKFPLSFVSPTDDLSFGASVLLQADSTGSTPPWVQIGAPTPRTRNETKLPGRVHRCTIGRRCNDVTFEDIPGNKKYENFVGGAMASQSPETPGTVVVCGSRWHDPSPHSGTYLFTGACNWMETADQGRGIQRNEWLTPLLDKDRALAKWHNPIVYDWAIGQAGFSAHFPWKNRKAVVLGAPGVENWRGSVLYCKPDQENIFGGARRRRQSTRSKLRSGKLSLYGPKCEVPTLPNDVVAEFDYLGYQVTSGEFFVKGQKLLVASAPRAGKGAEVLSGMVRVFRLPLINGEPLRLVTSLVGNELGSYFGASLATGDFNGDRFDDLVVGAPLSTNSLDIVDAGAVHQFLGGRGGDFNRPPGGLLQGRAPGGRFGQTLACPGDLNKDGFADLVVGAPHEDNGRGAIYIFNGGKNGLDVMHTQRIAASDVGSLNQGFGISLSPAVDIDGNKYSDLAVGSYGAVLLLRSYPVVELRMTVSSKRDRVPQNATSVTVTACITFHGVDAPSEIDVIRTVEVGSGLDIVQLVDPITKQQQKTLTSNIHLNKPTTCNDLDIVIKEGSKYQDVIIVQASARLDKKLVDSDASQVISGETRTGDKFRKHSPVERRRMEPTTLRLEFENDCKNQTCIADLGLSWRFERESDNTETHVVGSVKPLHLVVGVSNQGEPAYRTRLMVTVPLLVALANVPSNCEFDEINSKLTCDLRDLTPERNTGSVSVSLDMSSVLQVGDGSLGFVITADTLSKQLVENKHTTARLTLIREAKLAIYGKPVGRASYRYASGNASAQQVDFAHEFSVDKMGESPIDDAVIRVRYPYGWRTRDGVPTTILFARKPEVLQDGQPLTCTSSELYLNETSDSEGLDSGPRTKRDTSSSGADQRDVLSAGESIKLPANETIFLDCHTAGALCANISCKGRPFLEDSTVRMVVRMRVDIAAMSDLLGGKRIVSLSTFGDVLWDGETESSHVNATTHFIGAAEVKKVENWIIALSIVGGLLLFVFVVMGLIKAGFFQRKQKMEMEALIEQEEEIKAMNRQSQMPQGTDSDGDE